MLINLGIKHMRIYNIWRTLLKHEAINFESVWLSIFPQRDLSAQVEGVQTLFPDFVIQSMIMAYIFESL